MTQVLPPKKDVALALLERSSVDVHLDPRAKGVVVPPQFRKEPRLVLKIGLNMPVPIPDLHLDDESMSCTLSFSRTPFYCIVPWLSVFAIFGEDGRGILWPDDMPSEFSDKAAAEKADAPQRLAQARTQGAAAGPRAKRAKGVAKEAAPPSSGDERPARRRSKKKKDEEERPRPVLVAVPAPPPSSPKVEEAEPAEEQAPPPTPARKPAGIGAPRAPAGQPRPKRELPPYLRVVK